MFLWGLAEGFNQAQTFLYECTLKCGFVNHGCCCQTEPDEKVETAKLKHHRYLVRQRIKRPIKLTTAEAEIFCRISIHSQNYMKQTSSAPFPTIFGRSHKQTKFSWQARNASFVLNWSLSLCLSYYKNENKNLMPGMSNEYRILLGLFSHT